MSPARRWWCRWPGWSGRLRSATSPSTGWPRWSPIGPAPSTVRRPSPSRCRSWTTPDRWPRPDRSNWPRWRSAAWWGWSVAPSWTVRRRGGCDGPSRWWWTWPASRWSSVRSARWSPGCQPRCGRGSPTSTAGSRCRPEPAQDHHDHATTVMALPRRGRRFMESRAWRWIRSLRARGDGHIGRGSGRRRRAERPVRGGPPRPGPRRAGTDDRARVGGRTARRPRPRRRPDPFVVAGGGGRRMGRPCGRAPSRIAPSPAPWSPRPSDTARPRRGHRPRGVGRPRPPPRPRSPPRRPPRGAHITPIQPEEAAAGAAWSRVGRQTPAEQGLSGAVRVVRSAARPGAGGPDRGRSAEGWTGPARTEPDRSDPSRRRWPDRPRPRPARRSGCSSCPPGTRG